jgi:2-pyrone-4,6-dicarboxylate lactonase
VKGEDILQLEGAIRRLPLPFVIDHLGRVDPAGGVVQPAFQTLLALMRLEGAWVKLSAPERMGGLPFDAALPFARALIDARPDRVLWGTDFPHPNLATPVDERDLVAFIPAYAPDPDQQKRLLVDNPARLYGFDAAA